jgi:DHA1 family bicyclomycin/chloramphenicol resistance-like MFS transporter
MMLSQTPRTALLPTLTAISALGMVASTIYVPSVIEIADALGTSVARVQLTFVGYLAAFALGMLVLGPLSDHYGRRRTLVFGLCLCTLCSVLCMLCASIEWLIVARIGQGFGACAGMVVGRATTRDVYGRDGAAQVIAGRAIATTILQSLAPVLGGYLQAWSGWRTNFAAVALFGGLAVALALAYIPETRERNGAPLRLGAIFGSYRTVVGSRRFLAYALAGTGAHAGFHVFAAGAPAVLIGTFGVYFKDYGFYAALPPVGFLVGSFLSNRLSRRLGVDRMIGIGGAVLIPTGMVIVMLALLHVANPYAVIAPMVLICCGSGLITPNAIAGGIGVNPKIVGSASALYGFLQMAGASAATALLSLGGSGSHLTLAIVIAGLGLFAIASFAFLIEPATTRRPLPVAAGD